MASGLALALPGTALGATPLNPPEPPEPSPLDVLLGLAQTLLGVVEALLILGVGLGIVWFAARLVAAIGPVSSELGPVASELGPAASRPGAVPSGSRGGLGLLVTAAVAVAGGVPFGRSIAYARSVPGEFPPVVLVFAAGIGVVALVVTGGLALWMRHGQATTAIRAVLLSAPLFAAGVGGGAATAGLTGGLYRAPVDAAAVVQLTLAPTQPAFTPRTSRLARCHSVPDGQKVAYIDAPGVGQLGTGTLGATIYLRFSDPAGELDQRVVLGLYPADLPEGVLAPSWEGPARLQLTDPLGMAGSATFEAPAVPSTGGVPTAAPAAGAWPALLAGSLTWTCARARSAGP